jgi:hypothetical protein
MYDFAVLQQRMAKLPAWKCTAISVVCAQKVFPVVLMLCLPKTIQVMENCLDCAWKAVGNMDGCHLAEGLRQSLHSAAEWDCSDSASLPSLGAHALDMVDVALKAFQLKDATRQSAIACSLMLDTARSFDETVLDFRNATASENSVLAEEQDSQLRMVQFLEQRQNFAPEVIEWLRKEAAVISVKLEGQLPAWVASHLIQVRKSIASRKENNL